MILVDRAFCQMMEDLWMKNEEPPDIEVTTKKGKKWRKNIHSPIKKVVKAHKAILGAASPYFDRMFKGNFRDGEFQRIVLQLISPPMMNKLIHYIYTGEISHVTEENLVDYLDMCCFFQLKSLKILVLMAAEEIMNESNCVRMWQLGETYNCNYLIDIAQDFTIINIEMIARDVETVKEIPLHILENIFQHWATPSGYSHPSTSMISLKDTWIKASPKDRAAHESRLMAAINSKEEFRFSRAVMLVSAGGLRLRRSDLGDFVKNKGVTSDTSAEAFTLQNQLQMRQLLPNTNFPHTRSTSAHTRQHFFLLGGGDDCRKCEVYDVRLNTWEKLTDLPTPMDQSATAAISHSTLFVLAQDAFYCCSANVAALKQEDCWRSLPMPPDLPTMKSLISVPGHLYLSARARPRHRLLWFDIEDRKWWPVCEIGSSRFIVNLGALRIGSFFYSIGMRKYREYDFLKYDLLRHDMPTLLDCKQTTVVLQVIGAFYKDIYLMMPGDRAYEYLGGSDGTSGTSIAWVQRLNCLNQQMNIVSASMETRFFACGAVLRVPFKND